MNESGVETEALPRTRLGRTFSALRYREFRLPSHDLRPDPGQQAAAGRALVSAATC